jgi:exopolysaccharide production protein ExoQ
MLKAFEKLFVMAMIAYGCQAFVLLGDASPQLGPTKGTASGLALQIFFHGVAAAFYVLHARKLLLGIRNTQWLMALVLYAFCSTAWSQDPNLTFRRSLILMATTMFGLYFGSRFELKEQIDILAKALLVLLILSAGIAIVAPNLGVESGAHLGNWRGLFVQKNALARISVLAMCVFFFWKPSYRMLRYFALAFGLMMLGMTRSDTGLVVLIALSIVMPLVRLARTHAKLLVPIVMLLIMAGAALGVVLVANSDLALALLGRDATLTGRTTLWHAVIVSIMKRPILGYGFDAFWQGMVGESGRISLAAGYVVPMAHNGALDLWLHLGASGLALFVCVYAICLRKALRFYSRHEGQLCAWPLMFLAFIFLYNVTEVTEMAQNSVFTMLFAAVAATVTFEMEAVEDEYPAAWDFEGDQKKVNSESVLGHLLA